LSPLLTTTASTTTTTTAAAVASTTAAAASTTTTTTGSVNIGFAFQAFLKKNVCSHLFNVLTERAHCVYNRQTVFTLYSLFIGNRSATLT
jgi:hypothetical protein